MKHSRIIIFITIFISLLINLLVCYFISVTILPDPHNHPFSKYIWLFVVYLLFIYIFEMSNSALDKDLEKINIYKANIFSFTFIALILFFTKAINEYSRLMQGIYFLSNFLVPIYLALFKKLLRNRFQSLKFALIYDSKSRENIYKWLDTMKKEGHFDYMVIFEQSLDNIKFLDAELKIIETKNLSKDVDVVLFSVSDKNPTIILKLADRLQFLFKKVIFIPNEISPIFGNIKPIYTFSKKKFAFLFENKLLIKENIIIKRIFDIFVSVILLLNFLPIMITIYFLILFIDRSNPIFKHKRIGKDGKRIHVYKFRTMRKNADEILSNILVSDPNIKKEWEENFKLKDDPRVTKLGKFLRKTSLDELPQLINVLKGEMSLVGPRPITDEEIKKYGNLINIYMLSMPGITGLWQISGRSNLSYKDRVELDVWYLRNWSLSLDILILIKTITVFVKTKDSY